MATVIIPTPLRKFTGNTARVNVNAAQVSGAVAQLVTEFPDLKKHLLDEQGNIRRFVNVFVGADDIRDLQQENTSLDADTVVSIVPAIAGGNLSIHRK